MSSRSPTSCKKSHSGSGLFGLRSRTAASSSQNPTSSCRLAEKWKCPTAWAPVATKAVIFGFLSFTVLLSQHLPWPSPWVSSADCPSGSGQSYDIGTWVGPCWRVRVDQHTRSVRFRGRSSPVWRCVFQWDRTFRRCTWKCKVHWIQPWRAWRSFSLSDDWWSSRPCWDMDPANISIICQKEEEKEKKKKWENTNSVL